ASGIAFTAIAARASWGSAGNICMSRSTTARATAMPKSCPRKMGRPPPPLSRALLYFAALGIRVRRILTDNGGCYRGRHFQVLLRGAHIRHLRTRPYRPQTNGKAERFIRTLLHEWAYAQAYPRSIYRTAALPRYLRYYNTERRHTALHFITPAQRLAKRV